MKNMVRFSSALVLALAVTACSDDEDSSPTTGTASNQPAAGSGGSANAGAAGSAGAPSTSTGGSSAEAPDDDIDLQPGDGDDDNAGGNTPPSAADAGAGASDDGGAPPAPAPADAGGDEDTSMSFFVTSRGGPDGGNFGGLEGADALCTTLASAVSPALGAKTWRAYLSTSTVNARDRIGTGPWRNANGVIIGTSVEQLHDQTPGMVNTPTGAASEETYPLNDSSIALDETGAEVPNNPVLHDILTGSNLDGTVSATGTCSDWTSTTGNTRNGHSNRTGGGENISSWNSAHDTGCGADTGQNFNAGTVTAGGGRGSIYCFAAD